MATTSTTLGRPIWTRQGYRLTTGALIIALLAGVVVLSINTGESAEPKVQSAETQHGSAGRQGGVMEGTGGSASVAKAFTPSAAIAIREITGGGPLEGTGGHFVADVAPTNNQGQTGGLLEGTGGSAPAAKRVFPAQSGNGFLE